MSLALLPCPSPSSPSVNRLYSWIIRKSCLLVALIVIILLLLFLLSSSWSSFCVRKYGQVLDARREGTGELL